MVQNEQLGKTKNTDGTLGGRWHAEKVIDFDYPNKQIAVLAEAPKTGGFSTVPLGFQKDPAGHYTLAFLSIDIEVDGKTIPLLLDTGASAWPSEKARNALNLHGEQVATSFIVASLFDQWAKTHPQWVVIEDACTLSNQPMIRVPVVKIAGHTVGPVWFTRRADRNFHQFMSSMMDRQVDGALGGSALQYLRIIVDYPNEQALIGKSI